MLDLERPWWSVTGHVNFSACGQYFPRAQSTKGVLSLLACNLENPWERGLLLMEQKERSTTAVQTVCCCCARSVRPSLDGCTHRQDCSVCTRCSVSASAWSARCTSGTCAWVEKREDSKSWCCSLVVFVVPLLLFHAVSITSTRTRGTPSRTQTKAQTNRFKSLQSCLQ